MKKYLKVVILFLILSTLTFAKWITLDLVDEFNEKTKNNRIVASASKTIPKQVGVFAIDKIKFPNFEGYSFLLAVGQPLNYTKTEDSLFREATIKVKTENSTPIDIKGLILDGSNNQITGIIPIEVIRLLKTSKIFKIVYYDINQQHNYLEFELAGFNEAFKTLVPHEKF